MFPLLLNQLEILISERTKQNQYININSIVHAVRLTKKKETHAQHIYN